MGRADSRREIGSGVPRGADRARGERSACLLDHAAAWKRLALIGVILLLLVVELLNTAIEKLSDHVTPAQHPDIGRIKDMASAAVGVALAIAGFTWLLAIANGWG